MALHVHQDSARGERGGVCGIGAHTVGGDMGAVGSGAGVSGAYGQVGGGVLTGCGRCQKGGGRVGRKLQCRGGRGGGARMVASAGPRARRKGTPLARCLMWTVVALLRHFPVHFYGAGPCNCCRRGYGPCRAYCPQNTVPFSFCDNVIGVMWTMTHNGAPHEACARCGGQPPPPHREKGRGSDKFVYLTSCAPQQHRHSLALRGRPHGA